MSKKKSRKDSKCHSCERVLPDSHHLSSNNIHIPAIPNSRRRKISKERDEAVLTRGKQLTGAGHRWHFWSQDSRTKCFLSEAKDDSTGIRPMWRPKVLSHHAADKSLTLDYCIMVRPTSFDIPFIYLGSWLAAFKGIWLYIIRKKIS